MSELCVTAQTDRRNEVKSCIFYYNRYVPEVTWSLDNMSIDKARNRAVQVTNMRHRKTTRATRYFEWSEVRISSHLSNIRRESLKIRFSCMYLNPNEPPWGWRQHVPPKRQKNYNLILSNNRKNYHLKNIASGFFIFMPTLHNFEHAWQRVECQTKSHSTKAIFSFLCFLLTVLYFNLVRKVLLKFLVACWRNVTSHISLFTYRPIAYIPDACTSQECRTQPKSSVKLLTAPVISILLSIITTIYIPVFI